MTRQQEAITYFESQKKRLEDFRKIYPSPNTVGYQATTKEISFYDMAISALSENKTQMIDKSNFDTEQYKTDLQSAYDCGYNKALSENKGEWIDKGNGSYVCSNCKTEWTTSQIEKMCFCPTCGADMREPKGEDKNEENAT